MERGKETCPTRRATSIQHPKSKIHNRSPRHPSYEAIYRVARMIPRGRVANYGQVAALAGLPGHARQVGYAMHALRPEDDVPWHRVVNAKGEISPRSAGGAGGAMQRAMLEAEGVRFSESGKIDLERHRWEPKAFK